MCAYGSFRHAALLLALLAVLFSAPAGSARALSPPQQPALPEYGRYSDVQQQLAALAGLPNVSLLQLASTREGRNVSLAVIGSGDADSKRGVAVVGGAVASHLLGTELCLRLAERLASEAQADPALLSDCTFYFLPQVNPDAAAALLMSPQTERNVNTLPFDDDDDFRTDEDGAEDLNGDGLITMLRVADSAGTWRTHPDDPRVMIPAEEKNNEAGGWQLYSEGFDNDNDEQLNEDGTGGVDFNRNFTFNYPYFAAGAGPHQVCEPETRAVADFFYSHPNIALVLTFTPEDNLLAPWKAQGGGGGAGIGAGRGGERQGPHTAIHADDEPYFAYLGKQYRERRQTEKLDIATPQFTPPAGSFSEWVYYHLGAYSLAARGWWPANPKEDKKDAKLETAASTDDAAPQNETAPDTSAAADDEVDGEAAVAADAQAAQPAAETGEKDKKKEELGERGKAEIAALKWMQASAVSGFVDWQPVNHPDFPGQTAEVGGFKPLALFNPPAAMLDELAGAHFDWLKEVCTLLPRISVGKTEVEALGADVYRVSIEVRNDGYLPTATALADESRLNAPLQAELKLPVGSELLSGNQRERLPRIAGNGAAHEVVWLLRMPQPHDFSVRIWAPAVGETSASFRFDQQSRRYASWPGN